MRTIARLCIVATIFASLYLFRHFLIGAGMEFALPKVTGEAIVYQARTWEDGKLVYENFSWGERFQAEKAVFECNFSFFPFVVEPKVHLYAPLLQLEGEGKADLAFLLPTKYLKVKLDLEEGTLLTPEGQSYGLEFVSGTAPGEIGTLFLKGILKCGFWAADHRVVFDLQTEETSLAAALPLISTFYPIPPCEGSATVALKGILSETPSVQGTIGLKNFKLESPELICAVDEVNGEVDFHEGLELKADFKGADTFWKEMEVLRGNGTVVLNRGELPTYQMAASVHCKQVEGQASIAGQGFQGKIDYVTKEVPITVEYEWKDQVLKTEVSTLIKEVAVEGKMTSFFDNNIYQKTEVESLVIHSEYPVQAQGVFDFQNLSFDGTATCLNQSLDVKAKADLAAGIVNGNLEGTVSAAGCEIAVASDVLYDIKKEELNFDRLQGIIFPPQGEGIDFVARVQRNPSWSFEAAFSQAEKTVLTLQGEWEGSRLIFNEGSASGSYFKTPFYLTWKDGKIERAEGVITLETERLIEPLSLMNQFGLMKLKPETQEILLQLKGTIDLKILHTLSQAEYALDGKLLQAHLFHQGKVWILSHCQFNGVQVEGRVVDTGEQFDFDLEGVYHSRFNFHGKGIFAAGDLHQLSCSISDKEEPLVEIKTDQLIKKQEKWESPSVQATFFSKHLKEPLKADMIVSLGKSSTFQGTFKDGHFYALHEGSFLHLKGKTGSYDLMGKFTQAGGDISVQHSLGIKIKGYLDFAGTFKGELEGTDVAFKEHLVHEIHGKIDATLDQFKLKDLTLQDPAGSITIKECLGTKSDDDWNISIPLLRGQEIKLSSSKPFKIRQLVLTDITGKLSDPSTFQAEGSLVFTQQEKKEPSLFDIPKKYLKDFGLDLDLFAPVMGEVKLQLKDGRILLTELKNSFSEGKRSEFALAEEPSFIEIGGRLFLNLRMRQNVALKLVEPFMIAVRGTWEQPKYSLH